MIGRKGRNAIISVLPKHKQENYGLDNNGVMESMAGMGSYFEKRTEFAIRLNVVKNTPRLLT